MNDLQLSWKVSAITALDKVCCNLKEAELFLEEPELKLRTSLLQVMAEGLLRDVLTNKGD